MKGHTKTKTIGSCFGFVLLLLFITIFAFVALINTSFVSAESKEASVYVTAACTMSTTPVTTHLYAFETGSYHNEIGKTKVSAICNDAAGFSIYAIGYSGNTHGNTNMVHSGGQSIATGTGVDEYVSNWSLKLEKDMESYNPSNMGIENGYNNYKVIPGQYTKVVSYNASTTPDSTAGFFSSFAVNIGKGQASGSYSGKVKFTMVHPANEAAPEVPND